MKRAPSGKSIGHFQNNFVLRLLICLSLGNLILSLFVIAIIIVIVIIIIIINIVVDVVELYFFKMALKILVVFLVMIIFVTLWKGAVNYVDT